VPRCGPCRDRQVTALTGAWLSAGGALVGLPAALWFLGSVSGFYSGEYYGALFGLLAALVLLLLIQNLWINRRTVVCKEINDGGMQLRVPHPPLTRDALEGADDGV
jgi:hypothetical protein